MAKRLYISFAGEDSEFAAAFAKHLSPLRRSGKIEIVDDGSLDPNDLILESKIKAVHRADVVALLVSADFMADDMIWDHVLPAAMQRQARDRMQIIPILVRPQDLTGSLLQGRVTLPRKGGPVNSPRNDTAWTTIVEELRQLLDRVPERPDSPPSAAPTDTELRTLARSLDIAPGQEKIFLKGVLFQDVEEWRARMALAERCVCRVEIKERGFWRGVGTGFLIAPNRILTNRHVARDFASPATTRVQFDYKVGPAGSEDAGRMCALAATWNRAESPESALDYTIVELVERPGDDKITPTDQRGWLVPKKHDFAVNEPCFILQHPNAQRMKFCAGAVSQVAPSEHRVFYTTNTEGGSSGSPCFTIDWDLVALHHAYDTPGNRGIPMTDILADLGSQKALHLLGTG